ncbi:MAG TPA: phage holin family protein [Tessaracoccus flavescens]|uniref:Phage holin family protein n=1 Tax=Tessaracoccus flavescens TaxID=399497 RepID=A0A921JQ13_9ACTN|nr:phage holin family protein [Tessaracoccus flavescens]
MQSPQPNPLVDIKDAVSDFISKESELAAAEIKPAAKAAGFGAGFFAGAAVFVLHAVWMLVILIALAVGLLLNALTSLGPFPAITLGFLVSVLFSLLVAGILFVLGRGKFKQVKKPEATIAEAKATLDVVVDRLTGGKSNEVVKVDDLPRYRDADLEKTFGRP